MRMVRSAAMVLVALVSARRAAPAQDVGIPVGSKAPAAAVQTLDSKPADLADFIGKTPVLIEFWATWCPNCKELEPAMKAAAAKYGSRVKFVGVSVTVNQSVEHVKAYVLKHVIPGTQVWDARGKATEQYDVPATSFVVVIDKAGKVVYTGVGGTQDLDAAIKKGL